MIETNAYQCEKCEEIYLDKRSAEICEKVHAKKLTIERAEFNKEKPFPASVTLRIETDGKIDLIEYYR